MKYNLTSRLRKMELDEEVLKEVYAIEVWALKRGYRYRKRKQLYHRNHRNRRQMELIL